MRVTVEALTCRRLDAAQPRLGRALEMHQEQQLLQRESVDRAEAVAESLLDAGMGVQQGEHGGEGWVGHGGDISRYTSVCKHMGSNWNYGISR